MEGDYTGSEYQEVRIAGVVLETVYKAGEAFQVGSALAQGLCLGRKESSLVYEMKLRKKG